MRENITNSLLKKTKPADKPFEIHDAGLKGLLLRVQPTGAMTYYLQYQRGSRVKIGPADALSPEQAREIAKGVLAEHYSGQDPIEKRRRIETDSYMHFLNETYRPWLEQRPHSHPKVAYDTLTKGFPELLDLRLSEITPGLIEKWRVRRRKEGISESTINRQLSDLRACLNRAKDIWGVLSANPLEKVKSGRTDKRAKVRYLTDDEESRLRLALDDREADLKAGVIIYAPRTDLSNRHFADHLKPAVLVALNTGLRRGELLKLKWENVGFEQRNLTVIAETAKDGETRHIPLNDEALSVLRAWKEQPGLKSLYVFPDETGQPFHDMRTSWEGVLERAKITNFRFHDLRHTFASKLVMAGVDLNTVRELLGHSDYKMTLRYAHLAPEHKAAAVAKLGLPASTSRAR